MTLLLPAAHLHAGGDAAVTTLSFIDSVTTDNSFLTTMAGINPGDLLIWYDYTVYASSVVVPTGFTQIGTTLSVTDEVDVVTAYKIAIGNESSTSILGMNGYYVEQKILLQFRGDLAINSITVQDVSQQITDGNPAAQVCNASGGAVPLIVIGTYSTFDATVDPRTFSTTADGEISIDGPFNDQYIKYKIYNSSPADTTIDMDDENVENSLQSFYLEVS